MRAGGLVPESDFQRTRKWCVSSQCIGKRLLLLFLGPVVLEFQVVKYEVLVCCRFFEVENI